MLTVRRRQVCAELAHLADGTEPGLKKEERAKLAAVVGNCHIDPRDAASAAAQIGKG